MWKQLISVFNFTEQNQVPEFHQFSKNIFMKVNQQHYKTVWYNSKTNEVNMIDQNLLPFDFKIKTTQHYKETVEAIKIMTVRGAGAIGATAGFAMAQAACLASNDDYVNFLKQAKLTIEQSRPTARNLFYAVDKVFLAALQSPQNALSAALDIALEDEMSCKAIGLHGVTLLNHESRILTHCNAGWLAFVDYGSAISPVYEAARLGMKPFVYCDETRPRLQGARLTAWELNNEGVEHLIIPDNAAAYLMWQGKIDVVIVGADRIARNGDVANKIGTLEKAICARQFNIPFYVAAPFSTIDFQSATGNDFIIEERSSDEVSHVSGLDASGTLREVMITSPGSTSFNPAFDVTAAELVTGIITEKGIIKPSDLINFENLELL
jgi:S-methyl-5-thioribose-1-phosphate isomerase